MKVLCEMLSKAQMAAMLYLLGVIQFGEFLLKAHRSGWPNMKLSPYFINLRTKECDGPLTVDEARFLGQQLGQWFLEQWYFKTNRDMFPSLVVGIPRAGLPLAEGFHDAVAHRGSRILTLHKTGGKESEIAATIEGEFTVGEIVLVIDDVVTDGASKLEMAKILRAAGLEPIFVVMVDRGGADELRAQGEQVYAMFTYGEIMGMYRESGVLTPESHQAVIGYDAYMKAYKAENIPLVIQELAERQ